MTNFSTLLSSFIEDKNIQIYPLTQYCSLDRSTMYKYINGKRLPPRQELVERIADYMRLSPSEHDELLTAWKIALIGEEDYYNRKNAENFILNFPDVSKIDPLILSSFSVSSGTENPDPLSDCQALSSQTAINHAVSQTILREAEKEDGRLALLLQPDNDYLFHFLTSLGESECTLSIEQILCLNNSSQLDKSYHSLNLLYIQNVLPLYIRALDYDIYYYYDNVGSHFSSFNGLSCLILTSSCAITCTSDFQSGILYGKPEIVQMLQKHFDACREKCSPFFSPIHSIEDTCEMILKFFSENDEYYSLQPEPCIIPFLTPDLVERIIRPDLPGRAELISLLNDFFRRRKDSVFTENYHIFHTTPGLRRFMETGRSYEIPEDLYVPFSPEDRKLLLYRLSPFFPERYHLLRGPLENLPQNFHLWANASNGYMMFTNRKKETVYLLFTEPGLLTSFIDYLKNLEEKYLYTGEECHHLIEELLEHV